MSRFARFLCNVLGWHTVSGPIQCAGINVAAECSRCGRRVLLDSQGNWFAAGERSL